MEKVARAQLFLPHPGHVHIAYNSIRYKSPQRTSLQARNIFPPSHKQVRRGPTFIHLSFARTYVAHLNMPCNNDISKKSDIGRSICT